MDYILAAVEDWNKQLFDEESIKLKGNWHYCNSPMQLISMLESVSPRYIFFPHWRWIVPEIITKEYECVCFHMTDVPYGRGGSPLQNLIVRGHKSTMLTALRMQGSVDSGPVYSKKPLSIEGSAEEIYIRAATLSWSIIKEIISRQLTPTEQKGVVTKFERRTPEQSEIPSGLNIEQVYDYIRMLDAPNYPKAYMKSSGYTLEFHNARLQDGMLTAEVQVIVKG